MTPEQYIKRVPFVRQIGKVMHLKKTPIKKADNFLLTFHCNKQNSGCHVIIAENDINILDLIYRG